MSIRHTPKPQPAFTAIGDLTLRHHSAIQRVVNVDVPLVSHLGALRIFGTITAGVVDLWVETLPDHAEDARATLEAAGWVVAIETRGPLAILTASKPLDKPLEGLDA